MNPKLRVVLPLLIIIGLICGAAPSYAQTKPDLAGRLRLDSAGVEVQRQSTTDWVSVHFETLIGVGDRIRTDKTGRATLTFGKSLISLQVFSDAEIFIKTFSGESNTSFDLTIEVDKGVITQRGTHFVGDNVNYTVIAPAYTVTTRVGDLDLRVEPNGRTALVSYTADLSVKAGSGDPAIVKAGYGLRAELDKPMSDIVRANSLAQLDSALDGCPSVVSFSGDYQLNVRRGAGTDYARIGAIDSGTKIQAMGKTVNTGWIRIAYQNGFGWINTSIPLEADCAGLREYVNHYGTEDVLAK